MATNSLHEFMLSRGMDQACVEELEKEKLDEHIIAQMQESELVSIIPALGDRHAVINFCKGKTKYKFTTSELATDQRPGNLLDKLRAKLKLKRHRDGSQGSSSDEELPRERGKRLMGNKNASKSKRKIQIGWIDFQDGDFKQVRVQKGGGTRQVYVNRSDTKDNVLNIAKGLFFPNGKSPRGKLTDFTIDLTDMSMQAVESDMTIGEMYDTFKIPMLRCYLSTVRKADTHKKEDAYEDDISLVSSDDELPSIGCEVEIKTSTPEPHEESTDGHFSWELEPLENASGDNVINTVPSEGIDPSDSTPDGASHITCTANTTQGRHINTSTGTPTIQFGQSGKSKEEFIVLLRRSNMVNDMVNVFSDASVLTKELKVRMVLPNGNVEVGEGEGVYRDALSEFWSSFSKCTSGYNYKVPFIRHDFGQDKWEAIGRILLKGWQDLNYIPVMLAPIFLENCIYGASQSDLLQSFLQFVSEYERDMFERALLKFEDDTDDLLEVLQGYDCKRLPTASNFKNLLEEIGHKELIQRPMFVADCWRPILRPIKRALPQSEFQNLYEKLIPSPKKVLQIITFPDNLSAAQHSAQSYLRKYIRSLNIDKLKLLLRFCTGADILCIKEIKVRFTSVDGFARSPVGHTCGCVLDLPDTYACYIHLKNEFDAVLASDVWIMDLA